MRNLSIVLVLALPIALIGCKSKEETPEKAAQPAPTSAETAAVPAVETPPVAMGTSITSQEAGGEYQIDPAHTQVFFKISHFGVSHQTGMFRKTSGSFKLDADDAAKSTAAFEIDAASVYTADQKRDDHLKSPDFFDVKQFPTLTFKSTSIETAGENLNNVTGDLTKHGVKKSVLIPLTHNAAIELPKEMGGAFITGFDGSFTINRHDFGIAWGKGALGDEVVISLTLEGSRQ